MSKIKKICLSAIFFIILIFINNKASATTISITPSEPKVGDTITVTVTVPNVHTTSVTASVSGAVSGTIKVVGGDLSGQAKDYSNSAQFKCEKEGTVTVEVTGESSAVLDGKYIDVSAQKTVTVQKVASNSGSSNGSTDSGGGTTTKSSEARLRDLGITPNDFKGFKKDIYTYDNIEVPNNVSKVNVYAKAVDSNATIKGTGNVTLKEGNNTVKVTVTAEDGKTTKTYTLNITRKTSGEDEDDTKEARLKNLGIRPKEYDFSGFKRDTTEYSVEVPNDVEEVEVYAEAVSSKAKITGTGNVSLKEGENQVKVEVTAEDGTTKIYTLKITRKENTTEIPVDTNNENSKILGLSALLIKGVNMNPEFDTEIYEYTVGLTEDLSKLDIEVKANNPDAIVEIIGNEDLKDGENIITILVSNAETEEHSTYQIIVNKNIQETNIVGKVDWLKPSTWGLKEKIIIAVVILLIIVIIVAIVIKVRMSRADEEDFDLPGSEELDRAWTEHQELTEDDELQDNEDLEAYLKEQEQANVTLDENDEKSDIEKAQEYFEEYSKRKGKHF